MESKSMEITKVSNDLIKNEDIINPINNFLVDLFLKINSMRIESDSEILKYWYLAFETNPLIAMRILFYSRDVRGGQGERRVFRVILKDLAKYHPDIIRKVLYLIPEFGRVDDLLVLLDTPLEDDVLEFIKKLLYIDKDSLTAKWLPRIKSSKHVQAKKIMKYLGLTPKEYRKLLSTLTNVVETKMCAKQWDKIDFEQVPFYAMKKYRKAFLKNSSQKWSKYLNDFRLEKTKTHTYDNIPSEIIMNLVLGQERYMKVNI